MAQKEPAAEGFSVKHVGGQMLDVLPGRRRGYGICSSSMTKHSRHKSLAEARKLEHDRPPTQSQRKTLKSAETVLHPYSNCLEPTVTLRRDLNPKP